MFGVFPKEVFAKGDTAERLATDLHKQVNRKQWKEVPQVLDTTHNVSIRMLVFTPETATHAQERVHVDLQHVLDFVRWRMRLGVPCAAYRDPAVPSASPWRGCARPIVEVLDEAYVAGEHELKLEELITSVLARWCDLAVDTKKHDRS